MNKRKSQLFENENRTGRNVSGVASSCEFRSCGYGLFVNREGVVKNEEGKIIHQQRHKSAWRIYVVYKKKYCYPTVASLVARAWCPDWFESLPMWERGLKQPRHYNYRQDQRSLPMWERGLKQTST